MEASLADDVRAELQRIGDGLDARRPVRVKDGGIVILDPQPFSTTVQEKSNEQQQGAGGPAARSRQGSTRRQRSSDRSRAPRAESRIVGLAGNYAGQLENVQRAYPGATLIPDDYGVWLLARSRVVEGLGREAIFLIALPKTSAVEPRGWAFWDQDGHVEWIGPRHTNFPDGSVCAYHPTLDKAWSPGGDLRTLLDLYSVWVLRHLHLAVFDRWPGRQHAMPDDLGQSDPYYRLTQFKDTELCSCGSDRRYGECCRPHDLKLPFLSILHAFKRRNLGLGILDRAPPAEIAALIAQGGQKTLPPMLEVHSTLRAQVAEVSGNR
ncbi:hypothetical protein X756_04360 [Mesorhizobium sp. LSHC412B00]|nr:hypothetical protein X756_04360 [Mesorhizobium sp. LSHC412B00]